ncbi:MAG: glycosyltransferase family 2 protein, partial [Oscillospiraceae bacterium]
MKKISVIIPCYNDEKTIAPQYEKVCEIFASKLPKYDYEIIFADDCSPDNTWNEICKVCAKDKKVKGVHNIANFGVIRNLFSCLKYGVGDAVFMLMGDMQEPVDLLPEFIEHWEAGAMVTVGQKVKTNENFAKKISRKIYYYLISKFATKPQISNFTGYGLYD